MKLLNKITVKNVLGRKPNAALLGEKGEIGLMTVYGAVKDSKAGSHNFGDGTEASEYTKFFGDVRAVRTSDGVEFRSRECILPKLAEGVLASVVDGLNKDEGESVRFAFDIGIKKSEATIGYEFTAEPLVETEENDPLKDFGQQLLSGRKEAALPAPESPPAKKAQAKK